MRDFQGSGWPFVTTVVVVSMAFAGVAMPAHATPGGGPSFLWSFHDTDGAPTSSQNALAMRNGNVWPTVFNGGGDGFGLFSTGWQLIGQNFVAANPRLRAAQSTAGGVAVVDGIEGVVLNVPNSFAAIGDGSIGIIDVAFTPDGTLATLNEFGEISIAPPPTGAANDIVAFDVSPFGEIGGVTTFGEFVEYSPLTATWSVTSLTSKGFLPFSDEGLSMTYDSAGRAHVGNAGNVASFDPVLGDWVVSSLPGDPSDFIELEANAFGVAGTAFFDGDDLVYAYNDNNAGWQTTVVTTVPGGGPANQLVGINYDFEGLPVLAYSYGGTLEVAYDPIVVPEPASAVLLVGVGCLLVRRRR